MSDEQLEPQWSLIANIREWTRRGPGGRDIQRGTKHFSPGTKVYCCTPTWDQALSLRATVLGRHRGGSKLVMMVIDTKHLTNFRAKLIYEPQILADRFLGARSPLWGSDEAARSRVEQWVMWLRDHYQADETFYDVDGREPALSDSSHTAEPVLGGSTLLGYLSRLLEASPDPKVRAKAVGMLHKSGSFDTVLILISTMQHDDTYYVQHECSRVLRAIGTPEALAAVETWQRRQITNGI